MRKLILFLPSVLLLFNGCSPQGSLQADTASPAYIRVSSEGTDAAEPSVAVGENGDVYVTYVEHGADKSADVFLQKFDKNPKPQGDKVRINPNPGEAAAWRGDQPTIQTGKNGQIYVGWNRKVKTEGTPANDLMLSVSDDGGKSFTAPVKINDDTVPASHGMHAMAVDGEKVYFAWLDERYLKKEPSKPTSKGGEMHHGEAEPNAELYFTVSKDAGKSFSPNKKIAADICPCCKAQMIAAKDGRVYISWRQVLPGGFRHAAITSTGDGGEIFTEAAVVSDDKWQINACPVSGAPMAIGADGTLKVAWYTAGDAGKAGLYFSESKDQGKTFSNRTLLREGTVMGTTAMLPGRGGEFDTFWTENGKIMTAVIPVSALNSPTREVFEGELPDAAAGAVEGSLYLAYIRKTGEKRAVWMSVIKK